MEEGKKNLFSPVRCRCLLEKGNEGNYFNENGFNAIKCFLERKADFLAGLHVSCMMECLT